MAFFTEEKDYVHSQFLDEQQILQRYFESKIDLSDIIRITRI